MSTRLDPNRPTVPELRPRLQAYLDVPGNSCGGSLHIVVDDGNCDDSSVRFCIEYAEEHGDTEGAAIAREMLRMSKTQRAKVGTYVE